MRCPNITGYFGNLVSVFATEQQNLTMGYAFGAFSNGITDDSAVAHPLENTVYHVTGKDGITLNASLSSSVYSKSATVQPSAMSIQYLIKY